MAAIADKLKKAAKSMLDLAEQLNRVADALDLKYRCPNCQENEHILVNIEVWAKLLANGRMGETVTNVKGWYVEDVAATDTIQARCDNCQKDGPLEDFIDGRMMP